MINVIVILSLARDRTENRPPFQNTYCVIRSFEELFRATSPDFTPLYKALQKQPEIGAGDIVDSDTVVHRGIRVGWTETPDA